MPKSVNLTNGEEHWSLTETFLPDIVKDKEYFVVYAGFVNNNLVIMKDDEIVEFRKRLKERTNENTIIVFDCLGEGICNPMTWAIHKIIDGHFDPKNIYYVTCSLNIHEIYRQYCKDNHVTNPINVRIASIWEQFASIQIINDKPYEVKEKEKPFLCFNRIARVHRTALYGLLYDLGWVDKAYYSFLHASHNQEVTLDLSLTNAKHTYSPETYKIIEKSINANRDRIPLKLNIEPNQNITHIQDEDRIYFENSYFSLVTETLFNEPDGTIFFSEKIFKPIGMKHPFILMNAPGSLAKLRDLGYRTFNMIIDETYDTINNHEERLRAIVAEVDRLSKNTPQQWIEWQEQAREIVEHNYQVLKSKTNPRSVAYE